MKHRILVVDDEASIQKMLKEFLTEQDYDVSTAASGNQALKMMTKESFSLVLCDIQMPDLDGIQTLSKIKKTNKRLPVIMMSSLNSQERIKETVGKGATAFIIKPLNLLKTKELIHQVLMNA